MNKLIHRLFYRIYSSLHYKLEGIRLGQALNMDDRMELNRYRRKYPKG